ncbi:hypothetical protein ASD8599_01162 [Ascidiaceihabitans donghaensis]|uniref:Uncharacterized protein n=1 Tax=Ascidiaceihabitans donghaensis TaxID=1510460 RepID=A0A2R8BBH7_9RHOB|nr:hypothetical protein [Ascidiaceihabitans donghaensis]SPH20426.1 hypothetical protein ASD8599_01162 [Ascidiaceihabitans donghaensis]
MSDPVKSVEVEDVLSSIRRLVSEDRPAVAAAVQAPVTQDRLVLTPALRVMDASETSQDSDPVASLSTVQTDDGDTAPAQNGDDEWAHAPEDVSETPHQADAEDHANHADHGDDLQGKADDEAPFVNVEDDHAGRHADGSQEGHENSHDDGVVMDWDQRMADFAARSGDADVQDTETTEHQDHSESAPEALQTDNAPSRDADTQDTPEFEGHDAVADTDTADTDTAQTDNLDADDGTQDVVEAELMGPEEPFGHAAQAETLTSKIAALEAVIGKRDDEWEPDDTGDSDYSGTEAPSMTWDDAEPEAIDATVVQGANDFAETSDIADILDEETLREMVSDIVREELQGALGERITRNVRKLVRREIHRAIAAQDLE